jgi:hypothetical protein
MCRPVLNLFRRDIKGNSLEIAAARPSYHSAQG